MEEMLVTRIERRFLYYGETKHREEVLFTGELREKVKADFEEMHAYYNRRYTPKVKPNKSCKQCSLYNICMPQISKSMQADEYVRDMIKGDLL